MSAIESEISQPPSTADTEPARQPAADGLGTRLDEIARAPTLLVASDFDGTIAPIVSEPSVAEANRQAVVALKSLARMPQTHVAIISGRALSDLAARTGDVHEAHLVGSHGSEFEAGFTAPITDEALELLQRLKDELRKIASAARGASVEEKPASLAFHYRNAEEAAAARAVEAVLSGPAAWPGVSIRHGKQVIELSVIKTDKGRALRRLRQRLGASAVLFLGDDVTDEDAFETLSGPDVSVKVGPGPSRAAYRAADPVEVAHILARLTERRVDWLAGSCATPIEQHSILSDMRTAAVVDPTGRIVWLCLPRIDSTAIFSELVGGPTAGFFDIDPVSDSNSTELSQGYLPDTLLLETRRQQFVVTDYLDCGGGRALQRAGRSDLIRVIQGSGRIRITFAPRLDFGRIETRLVPAPDGLELEGPVDPIVLRAPGVRWEISEQGKHHTAVAEFDLTADPLVLELRYGTANLGPEPPQESVRRAWTEHFWRGWASTLSVPNIVPDLVRRSALTLRALSYGPTGAISAAVTTSLPEHAGGVRNWDYRFCWPRDAALSAAALVRLGAIEPAIRLLDWVMGVFDHDDGSTFLSPVYTVTGAHLGAEADISELLGYHGSRPVRVGNSAGQQVQLDVLGPIADLVGLLAEHGAPLSSEHWRMVVAMVNAVANRWRDPDHGIWEVRRARQHHVHSKVMCWQTVERSLAVARYLGRRKPDWVELSDQIAQDVLANGWKPEVNSFCATYHDHEPDAAALSIGLSGLLPADDVRAIGTIRYVSEHLRDGPTVYRYRYDDGLPGVEGGFNLCTTWLIEALARIGQKDEAAKLFEAYIGLAGPSGLMAEEFDPRTGMALGNFPQAYSHLGLINAALRMA